jgi:hypothetical protein
MWRWRISPQAQWIVKDPLASWIGLSSLNALAGARAMVYTSKKKGKIM